MGDARARYEDVSSRGEAALLSGDPAKREAWMAAMEEAEREVRAEEVAASVAAYQNAPLASACACNGTLHPACGKAAP